MTAREAPVWRTASVRCGANTGCVEVAEWRVASARCGATSGCVEVGAADRAVLVRDSVDPGGPRIALTPDGWASLLTEIKDGGRG